VHTYTVNICKPVYETCMKEVTQSICKPVHYTKVVNVCCGHWETHEECIPGPVVKRCVQEPGCWTWDPCCCRCVWCPGKCHMECVQCPPRKVCKKCWVSETKQQTIDCVRYERECVTKQVPCTTCRYVSQPETTASRDARPAGVRFGGSGCA